MESTNKRPFSYNRGIRYGGNTYPSSDATLVDNNGQQWQGPIFVDANSQYYTMQDGTPTPVTPLHTLDEVSVTAPKKHKRLSDAFGDFLTQSNDATMISNLPHKEYNPHLKDNAIKGAALHNAWEKDNPNLASWSYAASAVPFAVAATPVAMGAADAALATKVGQVALNSAEAVLNSPLTQVANTGIGVGFGARAVSDISQGKFTPSTALDLIGLPLGVKSGINVYNGLKRNDFQLGKYINEESSIPRNIKKEGAKRYTSFIESQEYKDRLENAGLDNVWENMKDLANKRVNGIGYFPGRMQNTVYKDPKILGLSSTGSIFGDPYYGITLKRSLYPDRVMPTLDHEIAHWATKNARVNDRGFLGDIMRYDESIAPNITWEDMLRKEIKRDPNMTVDNATQLEKDYNYLIDPQEKRARAMAIYQQAKDNKMTTDKFVDMWTASNGEIYNFAPAQLRDMAKVLTVDNIKKYLNRFLGVPTPVGIGTTLMNAQNNQNYDR